MPAISTFVSPLRTNLEDLPLPRRDHHRSQAHSSQYCFRARNLVLFCRLVEELLSHLRASATVVEARRRSRRGAGCCSRTLTSDSFRKRSEKREQNDGPRAPVSEGNRGLAQRLAA